MASTGKVVMGGRIHSLRSTPVEPRANSQSEKSISRVWRFWVGPIPGMSGCASTRTPFFYLALSAVGQKARDR